MPMDPNTWNAYHLLTNRAKAVCASKRQEQFRGLSEMTVNRLMTTAQKQLQMMEDLLENQNKLNTMTKDNIEEIDENDSKIKASQIKTLEMSQLNKAIIESAALDLRKEKQMREMNQREAAKRLNEVLMVISGVSTEIDVTHSGLEEIATVIKEITNVVELHNQHVIEQYNVTLSYLEKLNNTITYLLNFVSDVKGSLDDFIGITDELGINVKGNVAFHLS